MTGNTIVFKLEFVVSSTECVSDLDCDSACLHSTGSKRKARPSRRVRNVVECQGGTGKLTDKTRTRDVDGDRVSPMSWAVSNIIRINTVKNCRHAKTGRKCGRI